LSLPTFYVAGWGGVHWNSRGDKFSRQLGLDKLKRSFPWRNT
jgi:hypothetical protein